MRWILLVQCNSLSDLQRQRPNLERLLRLPGVSGFSLRVPSGTLNPAPKDWSGLSIFDEAMDIAEAVGGCETQFRSMVGRWAEDHASRFWGYYPGGNLGGTDWNLPAFRYPLPFNRWGGRNRSLYRYMMRLQDKLIGKALEARERGLRSDVVHMTHRGGTWAEVFFIPEMQQERGYSLDVSLQFDVDVMREAVAKTAALGMLSEFALSGHVYPGEIRGKVYGALSDVARNAGGQCVINRNDIRNMTNFDAMPTAYPLGWQSYANGVTYRETVQGVPGGTVAYDWPLIRRKAIEKNVVYYEAYPGNFGRPSGVPSSYVTLESVIAQDAEEAA